MAEEDDYEEEEATPEEKLNIAKYFVRQTPPGHIDVTIAALKKLNMSDVLDGANEKMLKNDYYTKVKAVCTYGNEAAGEERRFIVTPDGAVGDGSYLDTSNKKVVAFDDVTGKAGEVRDATAEELPDNEIRSSLQTALDAYTGKAFATTGCAGVYGSGDVITVCISGEKKKLPAFWSGRWTARYVVDVSGGEATVEGGVQTLCHYFEEGNVQMRSKKAFEKKQISYDDKADLVKKVASTIEAFELDLHAEFDAMIQSTQEASFRSLRRNLPINKQLFDWKQPQKYKVAERFQRK